MAHNPTTKTVSRKPPKPYDDFPLFAHATGQWAKKVRGRMLYFGPWADWQGALAKWQTQRDDLMAGRKPRPVGEAVVRLKDLANDFLNAKRDKMTQGELSPRTFQGLYGGCARILDFLGKDRAVDDLRPMTSALCVSTWQKRTGRTPWGR